MKKARGKIFGLAVSLAVAAVSLTGCKAALPPSSTSTPQPTEQAAQPSSSIILATTTSTNDSGLLNFLLPEFTKDTGIEVKVVAVGTGNAITMGVNGEADVLLVHSRPDEDKFMAEGHGTERFDVMYNDYVLVGPANDPLMLKGLKEKEAFKKIADEKAAFLSRGDDSGTHKKELSIWKLAEVEPTGEWYVSVGRGMGDTLIMTDEMQGYTLSDRATYLSMSDKLELKIVLQGYAELLNPYGILLVDPTKNNKINEEGAKQFASWLTSEKGQKLIGEFGKDKYSMPLFFPDAKK